MLGAVRARFGFSSWSMAELALTVTLWQASSGVFLLSLVQQYLPQQLEANAAFPGYALAIYAAGRFLLQAPAGWLAAMTAATRSSVCTAVRTTIVAGPTPLAANLLPTTACQDSKAKPVGPASTRTIASSAGPSSWMALPVARHLPPIPTGVGFLVSGRAGLQDRSLSPPSRSIISVATGRGWRRWSTPRSPASRARVST